MTRPSQTVGGNLRHYRTSMGLSLSTVAAQAGISAATLSRIETAKQNLDVALLQKLAGVLRIVPAALFDNGDDLDHTGVMRHLAGMPSGERARIFVEASRAGETSLDDVLSMLEVLRQEITRLQREVPRRRRR